jgi:predicted RNA-binding Zn-ribbon protein involved in translation (DUF1610 family)
MTIKNQKNQSQKQNLSSTTKDCPKCGFSMRNRMHNNKKIGIICSSCKFHIPLSDSNAQNT